MPGGPGFSWIARLQPSGQTLLRMEKCVCLKRSRHFWKAKKAGVSYEDAAARLGVGLGAVKTLIHRLRRQFGDALRREILQTVGAPQKWTMSYANCVRYLRVANRRTA